MNRDNVFAWYDPLEHILNETQRRQFDKDATLKKFTCEFFIKDIILQSNMIKYDGLLKGCGVRPIHASELQETVQQNETELEKGTVTSTNSSYPRNPY